MKKNKSMRLAGGLAIATMLSTSIVSGTYAKYVTTDSAEDSARVAKFGVTVTASGSLFDTTYKSVGGGNTPGNGAEDANGTTLTVESSGGVGEPAISNVLAPGTKNENGITFAITGTPEVDVKLDVVVENVKEVFLKTKTGLPDMTTGNATDTFDNGADYYPVKFTLTQSTKNQPLVSGGTLADVETALEALSSESIDANTDLSATIGTLKLTWEWAYGTEDGISENDKADTLLGDLAAGTTLTPAATLTAGTDYNLTESIEIGITVTQID